MKENMRSRIPEDIIDRARQMDLFTYLSLYEPGELVHFSGNTYTTRTHDSLKISNGKWMWWSRGIGGKSALDYLIKVREMSFPDAVEQLTGQVANVSPAFFVEEYRKPREEKLFLLPQEAPDTERVFRYLISRGIDREVLQRCREEGVLYESLPYHNAVFVGLDRSGSPRYAFQRGTGSNFLGEVPGSDKRYSFGLAGSAESDHLHLFEGAVDLLSYVTLLRMNGRSGLEDHLLSLSGVAAGKGRETGRLPMALDHYLKEHPEIRRVSLHLDQDLAGRQASQKIQSLLPGYKVRDDPPPEGKDVNDFLCRKLGLKVTRRKEHPSRSFSDWREMVGR